MQIRAAAVTGDGADESLSIAGVPWVTLAFLAACVLLLAAASGLWSALPVESLLAYGAKATPLILDRGDTWRLLAANFLHKDLLHLAFNGFALWNIGGALERAVRPADYVALLVFTALGTTLASAVAADSISLGASGIAFGVLAASATFGWRRGVRGRLRAHFGLRMVPWIAALFASGLGSAGVDNWGHAGGLVTGGVLGALLTPRAWPPTCAAHRLAAALGALFGTLSLGAIAAPALPLVGAPREGPLGIEVRMPLGWRRASAEADRVSSTNGLSSTWRSSALLFAGAPEAKACRPVARPGAGCSCARTGQLLKSVLAQDLARLADIGAPRELELREAGPMLVRGRTAVRVTGGAALTLSRLLGLPCARGACYRPAARHGPPSRIAPRT